MTNTSGSTVRYDTRSAAIVIDRLTIRDAPVVAECRHWANGSRGPAATDAELAECDLTPFVEHALAVGAAILGAEGNAQSQDDLIVLADDVGRGTTAAVNDAVLATKATMAAASESMADASDQAREAIEAAASAMRDSFTRDVTTACGAVTDEIRRLVGGDHPDIVASLHTELERFGRHLDQRAASRAIQMLAIVTRVFDAADPTSPLAKQNAELERQRAALADSVATSVQQLQQRLEALTSAIRIGRETVNGRARQRDPAPDSHSRPRDPPPDGRDHSRSRRRVLRHLRVDSGSGPEQDGDGVRAADGSTTRIVLEGTDSRHSGWNDHLPQALSATAGRPDLPAAPRSEAA